MQSNDDFKAFIISLFKIGGTKEKNIDKFIDFDSMNEFRIAFTHSSANETSNYELYEFVGDLTVNDCTGSYIRMRFPKIVNVESLHRLNANLKGGKILASLAKEFGFEKYVIFGTEFIEKWRNAHPNYKDTPEYNAILEDILEAFIGCLTTIVNMRAEIGVGFAMSYRIISSFLNKRDISLDPFEMFDTGSKLKELFESRTFSWAKELRELKRPKTELEQRMYKFIKEENGSWTVKVFGWMKNNRSFNDANIVEIGRANDMKKEDAKRKAAALALKKLQYTYRLTIQTPSPYVIGKKKKFSFEK